MIYVTEVDPDLIHPAAQIVVKANEELHTVTGEWWNDYVTKAKAAGSALINEIVTVIDDAGQKIRGFERTPAPAPAAPETPAEPVTDAVQ